MEVQKQVVGLLALCLFVGRSILPLMQPIQQAEVSPTKI